MEYILILLIIVILFSSFRAEVRHRELIRLLDDQATMIGEFFPMMKEVIEKLTKS